MRSVWIVLMVAVLGCAPKADVRGRGGGKDNAKVAAPREGELVLYVRPAPAASAQDSSKSAAPGK